MIAWITVERCQVHSQPRRQPTLWPSLLVLSFAYTLCTQSAVADKRPNLDDERLPGWKGEVHTDGTVRPKFTVLSWEPRIFHAKGLLSAEEADHLLSKSRPRMERSGVVDTKTGKSSISNIRTSSGMFFLRNEDAVITGVENRIAEWTLVPMFNGEGLQVLRYEPSEKYDPHFDYFFHKDGIVNGGNRLLTVLMYLSEVEEGGETVFPNVKVPASQTNDSYSPCAMAGLAVKPHKGDAVAFFSIKTDGRLDSGALHGGCPVIKGEKWSATKWIHVARYAVNGERPKRVEHVIHVPPPPPAPPGCVDTDTNCPQWAESGECESNPVFMVNKKGAPGACIWSCQRCDVGPVLTGAPSA